MAGPPPFAAVAGAPPDDGSLLGRDGINGGFVEAQLY